MQHKVGSYISLGIRCMKDSKVAYNCNHHVHYSRLVYYFYIGLGSYNRWQNFHLLFCDLNYFYSLPCSFSSSLKGIPSITTSFSFYIYPHNSGVPLLWSAWKSTNQQMSIAKSFSPFDSNLTILATFPFGQDGSSSKTQYSTSNPAIASTCFISRIKILLLVLAYSLWRRLYSTLVPVREVETMAIQLSSHASCTTDQSTPSSWTHSTSLGLIQHNLEGNSGPWNPWTALIVALSRSDHLCRPLQVSVVSFQCFQISSLLRSPSSPHMISIFRYLASQHVLHHDKFNSTLSFTFRRSRCCTASISLFLFKTSKPQQYCSNSKLSRIQTCQTACFETIVFLGCRHQKAIASNVHEEYKSDTSS